MSSTSFDTNNTRPPKPNSDNRRRFAKQAPAGAAEEFYAALEAATGESQESLWSDPMEMDQVKQACDLLLISERPDRGLDVLERSGVLEAVMPDVAALVGFGEGVRHKDVWMHTKQVIRQTPKRLDVRWAALLHDIGKVPTRRFESNGQVTFIGHPEVGARMFDKMSRRIPFTPASKDRVRFLIANHLRAAAYDVDWTESAVRRFAKDMGEGLDDLLDLSRGDITSKYVEKVQRGLRQIERLVARIAEVRAKDDKPAPLPTGLGNVIIERLGVRPGPQLGRLMRHLMEQVEAGRLECQGEFDHYLTYVVDNPAVIEGLERR